jgi:hypothetical protein
MVRDAAGQLRIAAHVGWRQWREFPAIDGRLGSNGGAFPVAFDHDFGNFPRAKGPLAWLDAFFVAGGMGQRRAK